MKLKKCCWASILMLWLSSLSAYAQQEKNIALSFRYSYLLMHSKKIDPSLANTYPYGGNISYIIQTDGSKPWQQLWKLPKFGFSAHMYHLRSPRVLGHSLGFTAYYEFSPLRKRKHTISYRIAQGISFVDNGYNPDKNPTNTLASTSFNFVMEGLIKYQYRIAEHWMINIGGYITHYSNGAMHLPNLGFNMLGGQVGATYIPNPQSLPKRDPNFVYEYDKKLHLDGFFAISSKMPNDNSTRTYYAHTLSMYLNKRVSRKSGLTLSFDWFYNESIYETQAHLTRTPDLNRVGIALGHELHISKVSFMTHIGRYVYRPENVDEPIYLRWGVKYYIWKRLTANWYLKTHYGKADVLEWGIGYGL